MVVGYLSILAKQINASATFKGDTLTTSNVLQHPLELPCGVVLKNRLVKAAMSDSLGDGVGNPTAEQMRLYERWAEGGAGLSLIGEVQFDPNYPEKPGNIVLGPKTNQQLIQSLASRGTVDGAHLWPQLGHAGALSHLAISQPKGPSPLALEGLQCSGLSLEEVQALPAAYAKAAAQSQAAGFGGVQIHAGHGFLLSQFLSPLFNHRKDGYGGSIEARCRIVCEIVEAVREAVGPSYPIGIKINSTDKLDGGLTEDDALEAVRMLDKTTLDLFDISGGTYFPGARASSDSASGSGPYFLEFARRAKQVTNVPVMATGGFKKQQQAVDAVSKGDVDMVGIARAMVLDPALANHWLSDQPIDPDYPVFDSTPAGGVTAWYTMRLTALAEDRESEFAMDLHSALHVYEERDKQRSVKWREMFSA